MPSPVDKEFINYCLDHGVELDQFPPEKTNGPSGQWKIELPVDKVFGLAMRGLTTQQIAEAFGICRQTLYQRFKDQPGVADAIKKGRAHGVALMANRVLLAGIDESKDSLSAAYFYLKCVGGWREKEPDTVNPRAIAAEINTMLREIDASTRSPDTEE